MEIESLADCSDAGFRFGYPYMLKKKRLAYDGRGNMVVHSESDNESCYDALGGSELYAEKWVPFAKELAIMLVLTDEGVVPYPVVETIQKDNICHLVIAPAQIPPAVAKEVQLIATTAISSFSGRGIYGVELFLLRDDTVLLNEIAPRPHNSGHYTMEACDIDQFEMHLRSVLSLPCPQPSMKVGAAMMINVLGLDSMQATKALMKQAMSLPGVGLHWYGKTENRQGRKMGHFTLTADDFTSLHSKLLSLGQEEAAARIKIKGPRVGIIMGSDSDLPTMKDAAEILEQFGVSFEITIVSAHRTPTRCSPSHSQNALWESVNVEC